MNKLEKLKSLIGQYESFTIYYSVDCKKTKSGKTAIRNATKQKFNNASISIKDDVLCIESEETQENFELSKIIAVKINEKIIRFKC